MIDDRKKDYVFKVNAKRRKVMCGGVAVVTVGFFAAPVLMTGNKLPLVPLERQRRNAERREHDDGPSLLPHELLDRIAAAPDWSWIQANNNRYDDIWPAPEYRPPYGGTLASPLQVISDFTGIAWDNIRHAIWLWGGGHAGTSDAALYGWSAKTEEWFLGFYSANVVQISDVPRFRPTDGNASPLSSHVYASNAHLKVVDRFLTFGGANHGDGDSFWVWDGDTILRRAGAYTCDLSLAGQGYVGGVAGSNPGPPLPGANAWMLRDWFDPARVPAWSGAFGHTACGSVAVVENGKDVVYYTATSGTDRGLYKVTIHDDNPDNDFNEVISSAAGESGGGDGPIGYDPERRILFKIRYRYGGATEPYLEFVDLKLAWGLEKNPGWKDVLSMEGDAADFALNGLGNSCGVDYDHINKNFIAWSYGGSVWVITPPEGDPTPQTGWRVIKPTIGAGTIPHDTPFTPGTGTYGRWKAARSLNCFVGVEPFADGKVWFLKPANWIDPRSDVVEARAPITPQGRYRNAQSQLFENSPVTSEATRVAGGDDYTLTGSANYIYVDKGSGWAWDTPHGDWLDFNDVRQGTAPYWTFSAGAVSGEIARHAYDVDVTAALQKVESMIDRWHAYIVTTTAPGRSFDKFNTWIDVVYNDKTTERLAPVAAGQLGTSLTPNAAQNPVRFANGGPNAYLEFARPTKRVQSATLRMLVTTHWSGGTTISAFLADPPMNTDPVELGKASLYNDHDVGLDSDPSIVGIHRHVDGSKFEDFHAFDAPSWSSESSYSPHFWDAKRPINTNKYPYLHANKFVGAYSSLHPAIYDFVPSTYTEHGFKPLAPGLGAIRHSMIPEDHKEGDATGYGGTSAGSFKLFLPEDKFGLQGHLYVRYYLRIAAPIAQGAAARQQLRNEEGSRPTWTRDGGKIGISPSHHTSWGGNSMEGGGDQGWTMRHSWGTTSEEALVPAGNAFALGFHLIDVNKPVSLYGDDGNLTQWGQRGGLGSHLYGDRWYCVETLVKLNTVMQEAPGYLLDSELHVWIDGRKAYERIGGFALRSLPLNNEGRDTGDGTYIRPCRELGIKELQFNWYNGGVFPAAARYDMFYTGLVWGTEYIGPMKGVL